MSSCQVPRLGSWATLAGLAALCLLSTGSCGEESGPRIVSVLPARAPSGATVDIVGERFAGQQRTVAFGGRVAMLVVGSDSRLTVRVPAGLSGLTIVVVKVDGRVSNDMDFYVSSEAVDAGVDGYRSGD